MKTCMCVMAMATFAWASVLCAPMVMAADAGKGAGKGEEKAVSAAIELVGDPIVIAGEAPYCAWADLIRLSTNGSLMVVYAAGAGHLKPDLAIHPEIIGDEISRVVSWKQGVDVGKLAGQPVRLRFVMKDADLFALRYQ